MAASPLRLCLFHGHRYDADGRPGAARLPGKWAYRQGSAVAGFGDKASWREWCRRADPQCRNNSRVSLLGARPLLRAEIQWLLYRRTQQPDGRQWTLMQVQHLVNQCRGRDLNSLTEADLSTFPEPATRAGKGMLSELRLIYHTRQDTRRAGFLETGHFGVRFNGRGSHFSLAEPNGSSVAALSDGALRPRPQFVLMGSCTATYHRADSLRRKRREHW